VPFVKDVGDKRTLCVDADQGIGTPATVSATMDVLKKSGCNDAAACGKALRDAGYVNLSGDDSRTQLGGLAYSYITAQKGAEYIQIQVYDYKHEKFDTAVKVKPPFVVVALPDGDAAVPKAELQKLVDALN
jgi:hypothetical protein